MTPPKALQDEAEIAAFASLLAREGVRSYLEVGSKFGGSLYRVAKALPKGSRLVSVDLNVNGAALQNTIDELNQIGYSAKLIAGRSADPQTVRRAQALAPFDAIFIDADHKPAAVTEDWNIYGPLARIVAFHDIGWRRVDNKPGKGIGVPEVWDKIKTGYRFEEIKLCPTQANNGIGVLWRH